MSQSDEAVSHAELEVADTIGQLMEFWGFKRPMGRLWTVLYLSPGPLSAAELSERLRMSAGAVSMTMNELLKWGAVKKTWRPGERRDYFEPETSVWKLVRRVLRERELRLVREVMDTLSRALGAIPPDSVEPQSPESGFKRGRIQTLYQLAQIGERLLASVEAGKSVDPAALREVSDR